MSTSQVPPAFAQLDVIDVTTVGRVSGRPHRIEIWFAAGGSTLYLLANSAAADWVRNLVRTPAVTVTAAGTDHSGTARAITEATEDRLARELLFAKYDPGYDGDLSKWRETAFPVAVDLDGAA